MRMTMTALLGAALIALMPHPSRAEAPQVLKLSFGFSLAHWTWTEGAGYFAGLVEQRSGGRLKIEPYPANQLGKEAGGLVGKGVAEIGLIATSYEPARFPLSSVVELPGLHKTSCGGSAGFWHLADEGGILADLEYRPNNLRALAVNVLPPLQLVTNRRQVTTLEDVGGLKLRANGGSMDATVRALGAVPVRVTGPELYDSLLRGTIDGGVYPIGSTYAGGLEDVIKYTAQGAQLGSSSLLLGINADVWQSLAPDLQAVMLEAGKETQAHLCAYLDALDLQTEAKLVSEGRLTVSKLTPAEVDRWHAALAPIGAEWAKGMEATGRPGAAVLDAYRGAMDRVTTAQTH